jgi:hypothetical protein
MSRLLRGSKEDVPEVGVAQQFLEQDQVWVTKDSYGSLCSRKGAGAECHFEN